MAYVVTRPHGRFEIRESVHTPKGPRARSLASFARFTDEVIERARTRASRPFDAEAVRAAAERAVAGRREPAEVRSTAGADATVPRHRQPETRQFVEASRRMVRSLERLPDKADRKDPGDVLMDLLEFVAYVTPTRLPGPEPLRFPPLARLRAARHSGSAKRVVSEE
jgi:hypothetical protein